MSDLKPRHCARRQPHAPHKWLLARRAEECPGVAGPVPRGLEPMVDVVHGNGTHQYRSTHCRHGNHADCKGSCKICASPCLCTGCEHTPQMHRDEHGNEWPATDPAGRHAAADMRALADLTPRQRVRCYFNDDPHPLNDECQDVTAPRQCSASNPHRYFNWVAVGQQCTREAGHDGPHTVPQQMEDGGESITAQWLWHDEPNWRPADRIDESTVNPTGDGLCKVGVCTRTDDHEPHVESHVHDDMILHVEHCEGRSTVNPELIVRPSSVPLDEVIAEHRAASVEFDAAYAAAEQRDEPRVVAIDAVLDAVDALHLAVRNDDAGEVDRHRGHVVIAARDLWAAGVAEGQRQAAEERGCETCKHPWAWHSGHRCAGDLLHCSCTSTLDEGVGGG